MNLLISALGNWMFSKVCSRHLLLHLSSQIAQPQHIPLYENYITAKNQWLHQTQQRRVWFLPWSQTVSSKNPLVSITYSWASWQSANVTRGEETVRKASPLHSSNPEWWRTQLFNLFHHTFETLVLWDCLYVDHLSTGGTSCSTILFGLPKKGILMRSRPHQRKAWTFPDAFDSVFLSLPILIFLLLSPSVLNANCYSQSGQPRS